MRYRVKHIIFPCLILFLSTCESSKSEPETSNQNNTQLSSEIIQEERAKQVVHFGFITRYNPRIMYEEYQPIMDYLNSTTKYHFELRLGKSYQDAVEFLKNGEVQVSSLGAVTYMEAHKGYGAVPILRPLNEAGEPFYRSLIITRKDSDIETLEDLRGRTFAFASSHSTSGNLIPRYTLAQAGVTVNDLARYTNLKHHDSVAKVVLSGEYDAGAVKDIIGYKYLPKGLRILHASEPIPSVPLVVRKDCPPELIQVLKDALLRIDLSKPEYQQLVSIWNKEFQYGFIETEDEEFEVIRRKLNAIPDGCGSGCHPDIRF